MFSWEKVTILQQIGKMRVDKHVSKLFVIKTVKDETLYITGQV